METQQILCKSILTRSGGYLNPVCTHSINPYVGCGYGNTLCGTGCYVQSNGWLTRGREWGSFLEVKTNAADVYRETCEKERRWAHRNGRRFSIFFSSSTEPWQPAEKKFRITRQLLNAMQDAPPDELILQTHSTLILEDVGVIASLASVTDLRVHISIETDNQNFSGLPRHACSVEDRIEAVRILSDAGVFVVVCMAPLLPMVHPESFFERLEMAGANAVVIDHFIGGDGTTNGSRTLKTQLPEKMKAVLPASVHLDYRSEIASIAERFLPTGISSAGFAGIYSKV